MVVFLYVFGIAIFLIIIVIFTTIKINVKEFMIHDADSLSIIIKSILKRDLKKICNSININIQVQFYFFNILPYFAVSFTNNSIKRRIQHFRSQKQKSKRLQKSIKSSLIFKQTKKAIIQNIKLDKLNFIIDLGTENSTLTASITGIIYIIISLILPYIASNNKIKNYYYTINQYYKSKNIFYLNLNMLINLKVFNLLKELKNTKLIEHK